MKPKNAQAYLIRIKSTFRQKRDYWYNGKAKNIYPAVYDALGNEFKLLDSSYHWQTGLKLTGSTLGNIIEEKHVDIIGKI